MALILKEVLKYPEFRTIASSRNYRLKKTNKQKGRWLGNHHKMIRYPTESIYSLSPSLTPTSGKTAFTTRAKTCLATSATNGDMELICIVMEDTGISVYWDTKHLLEYFFNIELILHFVHPACFKASLFSSIIILARLFIRSFFSFISKSS